ncbi:matrixin family metalloprotease [Demequina sp.]|uniref:matrixin family metalloprotease n=1 Tax=Demequina sp. TaxID=2050685 RepID=UPI0025EE959D|nr:matrixin family metalloprotease [Demequina sp.]
MIGIASLSISALVGVSLAPPPTDQQVCEAPVVKTSQLDAWNLAGCEGEGRLVKFPDGRTGAIPEPGWTVTAASVTAVGYDPIPDVTVRRGVNGDVAVVVEDIATGQYTAYGDDTLAADIVAGGADQGESAVVPLSTNPKCDNYSYTFGNGGANGAKWIAAFPYYRKSGILIPLTAIQGGINAMANGTGACTNLSNSASASYKGTTSVSSTISSSGTCNATDFVNVVDVGALSASAVASTCTYKNSSEISYADVRFNSAYTFYTSTSVTGCTGSKYDAQGIMTHEAGHVFGLGHVSSSTYQVMKTPGEYCDTDQRKLGAGDLAGMKSLYP